MLLFYSDLKNPALRQVFLPLKLHCGEDKKFNEFLFARLNY